MYSSQIDLKKQRSRQPLNSFFVSENNLLLAQVSYLLEGNPDRMNFRVKDTGMTPLHAAVKSGSVATLKVS